MRVFVRVTAPVSVPGVQGEGRAGKVDEGYCLRFFWVLASLTFLPLHGQELRVSLGHPSGSGTDPPIQQLGIVLSCVLCCEGLCVLSTTTASDTHT